MKSFINRFKNIDTFLKYFFIISVISVSIVSILFAISYSTEWYGKKFLVHIFSDYTETACFAMRKDPFTRHYIVSENVETACIYPPIAYMLVYPFALICRNDIKSFNSHMDVAEGYFMDDLLGSPAFMISYLLFFAFWLGISLLFVAKITGFKGKRLVYALGIVAFSAPIVYCFLRGNTLIMVFAALLGFYYFYEKSELKYAKFIAYFLLALAISIKIFPVLFAVIFIFRRKDLKSAIIELLICAGFTFVLVFAPFVLTKGGFSNVKTLVNNILKFNGGESRMGHVHNVSISSLIYNLLLHKPKQIYVNAFAWLVKLFILGITILLAFSVKEKHKAYLMSVGLYWAMQDVAYGYVLVLAIVPFVVFIANFEEDNNTKLIYALLYFLMSIIAVIYWAFKLMGYAFFIMIMFVVISELIKLIKSKKNKEAQNEEREA